MDTSPPHDNDAMSARQRRQEEIDQILMPPPPPRRPFQQRNVAGSQSSNQWVGFHRAGTVPRQQHQYSGPVYNGANDKIDPQGNFTSPNYRQDFERQTDSNAENCANNSSYPTQKRRDSRYFHRDEMLGQSKTAREITPMSLFHTADRGAQDDEQGYHDGNANAGFGENSSPLDRFQEEDHLKHDLSPVKTVIVKNKKRKRHNSTSTGTSTLVINSADSHTNNTIIPNKTFKDIIGHRSVKLRLEEIILPLKLPSELSMSVFRGIRSLPASVLLMGPPGTGKTLLAKAVAGEARAAFLPIGPSDVLSKYVGESEASVRAIFAKAVSMAKQIESKVTVIFFDEIDALGQTRGPNESGGGSAAEGFGSKTSTAGSDACSRRVLAELLIQLSRINSSDTNLEEEDAKAQTSQQDDASDAFNSSSAERSASQQYDDDEEIVGEDSHQEGDDESIGSSHGDESTLCDQKQVRLFVLAATNRPRDCDPALLRRFGIQVEVGLPRTKDRLALLKLHLKDVPHSIAKEEFAKLANATDGWSGSDLESLTRESAMAPVRKCIREAAAIGQQFAKQSANENGNNVESIGQVRAQIFLEKEIANLRPVNFYDYVNAFKFWSGRLSLNTNHDDADSPLTKLGYSQSNGSCSDEDDEEFDHDD